MTKNLHLPNSFTVLRLHWSHHRMHVRRRAFVLLKYAGIVRNAGFDRRFSDGHRIMFVKAIAPERHPEAKIVDGIPMAAGLHSIHGVFSFSTVHKLRYEYRNNSLRRFYHRKKVSANHARYTQHCVRTYHNLHETVYNEPNKYRVNCNAPTCRRPISTLLRHDNIIGTRLQNSNSFTTAVRANFSRKYG